MPNWKKLVVSGSDASLNSLNIQNAVTASYFVGDGSQLTNISLPTSVSGSFSGSFQGDGSGLTNLTVQVNEVSTAIEEFSNQTSFTVIHGLDTKNIIVNVYDENDRYIIPESIITNDINSVDITFTENTSGRVVVAKGGHIVTGVIQSESTVTASYSDTANFNIEHGFNTKNVFVTVYNDNDRQIIPSEVYLISDNSVNIKLAYTSSGFAVVAKAGHIVVGTLQDADTLDEQDGTYYLDYTNFTNVPSNIVSSSTQLETDISGSFTLLSASIATRFDGLTSDYTELQNIPSNIVSSSTQISYTELQNIPSNIVSSSNQISYTELQNIPSNIVSSSNQISFEQTTGYSSFSSSIATRFDGLTSDYTELTNIPGGIVSSSSQVDYSLLSNVPEGIVSSSVQVNYGSISNKPTGLVSSSNQINLSQTTGYSSFSSSIATRFDGLTADYTELTNIPIGIVSSSNQINIISASGYSTLVSSLQTYADNKVAGIVDSAPSTLDTLNELAAALGDDANFSTTVSTSIGEKLAKSSNLSDLTDTSTARTNLGLGTAATTDTTAYATSAQGTNADTAYGWGDHSSAGYLTSVNYNDLGNIPSGILSSSIQIKSSLLNEDLDLGTGIISASGIHFADGAGTGTLVGTSTLVLSASAAVKIEGAPLRFTPYNNTKVGEFAAQSGDVMFNSTYDDLQIYKLGSFRTILDSQNIGESSVIQGKLSAANNLNDLASATSARTNLGLGSVATLSVTSAVTDGITSQVPHVDAVYNFVTGQGYISNSGNQTINGTLSVTGDVIAYSTSDIKFKDNLIPIGNSTDKLKKLTGYEFDWNNNQDIYTGHDIGVVAQEVEKVLPEIVTTRVDGSKGVRYDKIIALLIESNKELIKRIEKLESMLK